ncbi:hypothetical protein [Anaerococcus sp.]|uniref:hypothetical protein n=1 Tax=Anaerococcus sp. TaxID=1872515 RepID=UPI0027B94496|nr:hypothetical protein [Anaerococcus sp.]
MKENINKFKKIAISGISFMGIGSFMSCLSTVTLYKNLGTAILILGLILSIIGFYRWRP